MLQLNNLLTIAIKASLVAGIKTLSYYDKFNEIKLKSDNSPLTKADTESNRIINQAISGTGIPVISEENLEIDYQIRKQWKKYWLVDPLDGTKEFIQKNGEYTINIALIENNLPVLGVVYIPVIDVLYYALSRSGSYKIIHPVGNNSSDFLDDENRIKLPIEVRSKKTVVVASRSHTNEETENFIKKLEKSVGAIEIKNYGSSLKLCMIAEGAAQIYPRMAPTMEWDIAAGHAIILGAGGGVQQYPGFESLLYNKESLLNPSFVAFTGEHKKTVRI